MRKLINLDNKMGFSLLGSPGAFPRQGGPWAFPLLGSRGAFTLVELIVVVTILAILATVGFASYTSHLSSVRDTARVNQLSLIRDNIELYRRNKKLPLPTDYIEIKSNGTVIGYQGYAGESVLSDIKLQEGGKDPMDKTYYTYYVTKNKKNFQLLAFLEEEQTTSFNLLKTTRAEGVDYEDRYTKVTGDQLGVLTESGSNTPVQEVSSLITAGELDIATTTDNYIAKLNDEEDIIGTGGVLVVLEGLSKLGGDLSNAKGKSCKEIRSKYGNLIDGLYKINPSGNNQTEVYCDMTRDGGGWTMVGKTDINGITTEEKNKIWLGDWDTYTKIGYGNPSGRIFWLALKDWYNITNDGENNEFILIYGDSSVEFGVDGFEIISDSTYEWTWTGAKSGYSGLDSGYKNMKFTTLDNDQDTRGNNCSTGNVGNLGGFWFAACRQNSMLHSSGVIRNRDSNSATIQTVFKLYIR